MMATLVFNELNFDLSRIVKNKVVKEQTQRMQTFKVKS